MANPLSDFIEELLPFMERRTIGQAPENRAELILVDRDDGDGHSLSLRAHRSVFCAAKIPPKLTR